MKYTIERDNENDDGSGYTKRFNILVDGEETRAYAYISDFQGQCGAAIIDCLPMIEYLGAIPEFLNVCKYDEEVSVVYATHYRENYIKAFLAMGWEIVDEFINKNTGNFIRVMRFDLYAND